MSIIEPSGQTAPQKKRPKIIVRRSIAPEKMTISVINECDAIETRIVESGLSFKKISLSILYASGYELREKMKNAKAVKKTICDIIRTLRIDGQCFLFTFDELHIVFKIKKIRF